MALGVLASFPSLLLCPSGLTAVGIAHLPGDHEPATGAIVQAPPKLPAPGFTACANTDAAQHGLRGPFDTLSAMLSSPTSAPQRLA